MTTPRGGLWQKVFWNLLLPDGKPFQPNATQAPVAEAFLDGSRVILICGGERSGKSLLAAALLGLRIGPNPNHPQGQWPKPKRFWIVGPDYRQCRPEFLYIHDALERGKFVERVTMPQGETQPWSLETKWGTIIETRSAGEVRKLASFTVDGLLLAEAGQQTEESFQKALGRTAETRGFILLVGTLEDGLPWYEDYLRRWQSDNPEGGRSFSIPTWSNLDTFPGGVDDPEIRRLFAALPADYVAHRFGAQPIRRSNLVVPEYEYKSHVRHLEVIPDIPLNLAIDPGKNAYAVLFCQRQGAYTYVHDCIYTRGAIAQQVIPMTMQHPLWPRVDLTTPNTSVIDIAGMAEPGTESQSTLWRDIAGLVLTGKYWKEKDTIAALRYRLAVDPILGLPLVQFSSNLRTGVAPDGTATQMLSEFDLWRWPKRTLQGNEPERPVDANNHALKALGYFLLHHYGNQRLERKKGNYGVKRASWNPKAYFSMHN